jgi:coenzyme F420-reducing hydrogenase beta subunit
MPRQDGLPTPQEFAQVLIARQADGERLLDDARCNGNTKEAKRIETTMRKFDKLLAQYGIRHESPLSRG